MTKPKINKTSVQGVTQQADGSDAGDPAGAVELPLPSTLRLTLFGDAEDDRSAKSLAEWHITGDTETVYEELTVELSAVVARFADRYAASLRATCQPPLRLAAGAEGGR